MATQVHEVFIRSTPEKVWEAMTRGELTEKCYFGTSVASTWRPGDRIVYSGGPGGEPMVEGRLEEVEPRKKLVHTWVVRYDPSLSDEESRVSYLLEPLGQAVKLTVRHDLGSAPKTARAVETDGWSVILSSMKTLLETGQPLVLPER